MLTQGCLVCEKSRSLDDFPRWQKYRRCNDCTRAYYKMSRARHRIKWLNYDRLKKREQRAKKKAAKLVSEAEYFRQLIYYTNHHPDNTYTFTELYKGLLFGRAVEISPDFELIANEIRGILHERT